MWSPTPRPRNLLLTVAAAAVAATIVIAATPNDPTHPSPADDELLAQLEANASLHNRALTRALTLHDAARISEHEVTAARIAALEAEILLHTARQDREAVTERLRQVVEHYEHHLSRLSGDEPDSARLAASQALAQARIRLWQASRE